MLIIAGTFAFSAVLLDGTLFRIWSLNRDRDRLEQRIESLKLSVADKEKRIVESNKPEFIERQVREQLDFVRDGDLVFVFADNAVVANDTASKDASKLESHIRPLRNASN